MTRLEAAFTTGAALLITAGTATAYHHMWWETAMFTAVGLGLLEGAARERHARRIRQQRARAIAQRAALLARGHAVIEPPQPCCQFWASSSGAVHGADCTRPAAARGSLTEAEQQLLARLDPDLKDSA